MGSRKVTVDQIPRDILGDLQTLTNTASKDYIAVGNNFYEIYPTSAVKLMEAIASLVDILDSVRQKKVDRILKLLPPDEREKFDPLRVTATMDDIITDREAITRLKELLPSVLEGIDQEDIDAMSIGQMIDALDKIITVNINTLPPSYREQMKKKQEAIMKAQQQLQQANEEVSEAAKNP